MTSATLGALAGTVDVVEDATVVAVEDAAVVVEVLATVAAFIVVHTVWSYTTNGIAKLSKSENVEIVKEILEAI